MLARADQLYLVPQEALHRDSQGTMLALCRRIGLDPDGVDFSRHFSPVHSRGDPTVHSAELLEQASTLYQQLLLAAAARA